MRKGVTPFAGLVAELGLVTRTRPDRPRSRLTHAPGYAGEPATRADAIGEVPDGIHVFGQSDLEVPG